MRETGCEDGLDLRAPVEDGAGGSSCAWDMVKFDGDAVSVCGPGYQGVQCVGNIQVGQVTPVAPSGLQAASSQIGHHSEWVSEL